MTVRSPAPLRSWRGAAASRTSKLSGNATAKRAKKGCDWLLANDVSPASGTFGGDSNKIFLIGKDGVEDWPRMTKVDAAGRLAHRIADHFRDLPFRETVKSA